jgi:hypothetical protein
MHATLIFQTTAFFIHSRENLKSLVNKTDHFYKSFKKQLYPSNEANIQVARETDVCTLQASTITVLIITVTCWVLR